MSNKKDPEVRMIGVCGCVVQDVKDALVVECNLKGVKLGRLIGEILTDWADGKPKGGKDERQGELGL